jgi:hypothetical protein
MRAAHLKSALAHWHWTLEDWKKVIWTDETGVILDHRCGTNRLWRRPGEEIDKTVIRRRWKGFTEFIFWGGFSYDEKGACHIFQPETAQEEKIADEVLEEINKRNEPLCRACWEVAQALLDLQRVRPRRGWPPQWCFTKKWGKVVWEGKREGIDWWLYLTKVLIPKLFPFVERCKENRPDTVVQEDRAAPHAHSQQDVFYDFFHVQRMLWPGNSPDFNMIEPCWMFLKRETTKNGPPRTRQEAERRWLHAWNELSQEKIRRWIERIPYAIEEVIRLEGGNEYIESTQNRRRSQRR